MVIRPHHQVTPASYRLHFPRKLGLFVLTIGVLLASGVGSAHAASGTAPTVTWRVTSLTASTSVKVSTLATSNSSGIKTWKVSGSCSLKSTTLTTKASGRCKVTVSIAAKGKYVSKRTSRTFTITTAVLATNIAVGCAPEMKFPNLSTAPGAGNTYTKPALTATCSGDSLKVTSNGMIGYTFTPITPNGLAAANYSWTITTKPVPAPNTTSIKNQLGTLGFTVTGIPIYGPTEGPQPVAEAYGDPVYNNILDTCKGHTGPMREYHYHAIAATNACYLNETIVGYANDGFPIYSNPGETYTSGYAKTGNPKTNSWDAYTYSSGGANTLDACNGRTASDGSYRYYVTSAFPYIIGCYKGAVAKQEGPAGAPMRMSTSREPSKSATKYSTDSVYCSLPSERG